jgi:hypothetical protein
VQDTDFTPQRLHDPLPWQPGCAWSARPASGRARPPAAGGLRQPAMPFSTPAIPRWPATSARPRRTRLCAPPSDATPANCSTPRWLAGPARPPGLALGEPGYPELLANIPDPPLLLYIRGRPVCWRARAWPSSAAAMPACRAGRMRRRSRRRCPVPACASCPAWRSGSMPPRTKARCGAAAGRSPWSAPGRTLSIRRATAP